MNNTDARSRVLPGGGAISFHVMRKGYGEDNISFNAGGNIIVTSISGNTQTHSHNFPEIVVMLKGRLAHIANGETKELSTGSMAFIRPGDTHSFLILSDGQCEMVNFIFDLEILNDLAIYLKCDFQLRKFTAPVLPPVFKMPVSEMEEIALRMLNISSLQVTSIEDAKVKIRTIVAELFMKNFVDNENPQEALLFPVWFEKLCFEMRRENNLRQGLRALKRLAPCTQEHLCLCFRKYLNKTPTCFINELRLAKAARRLIDTDDKIFTVAVENGFKSVSRFYKLFKTHFGVSPAAYRASRRNVTVA